MALQGEAAWAVAGDRIGPSEKGPELTVAMAGAISIATAELRDFGLNWPGLDNWVADSPVFKNAAGAINRPRMDQNHPPGLRLV